MGGDITYQESLAARLAIMRPTLQLVSHNIGQSPAFLPSTINISFFALQVEQCVNTHPPTLTPGVKELVATLRQRGTEVYLVTGR